MLFRTALQKAIRRGTRVSGTLALELQNLGEVSIETRGEAKSICKALELLVDRPLSDEVLADLSSLAHLFLQVKERGAFAILAHRGLPSLTRAFDRWSEKVASEQSDPMMVVLQVFANYHYSPGTERIITALTGQLWADTPMWHFVLLPFQGNHPEVARLLDGASHSLPVEKAAICLLRVANKACKSNAALRHPFTSEAGLHQLRAWVRSPFPRDFATASLAVQTLPFVDSAFREELLQLAVEHTDDEVALDAAYVSAKQGRKFGLDKLAECCADPRFSQVSKNYLQEIGCAELIPAQAYAPDHLAMEEFSQWLSDPRELGRVPDEISVFDQRTLYWPPHRSVIQAWLIRYRSIDRLGMQPDRCDCGFVGGMTFCYFSLNTHRRPPEDTYAYHCITELEDLERVEIVEIERDDPRAMLSQSWNNQEFIVESLECLARLKLDDVPRVQSVAVASAQRGGEPGWVARHVDDRLAPIDDNVAWYPAAEQPELTSSVTILKIHVGRSMLGFTEPTDRVGFLNSSQQQRDPQRLVDGYELLIEEALQGTRDVRQQTFGAFSPLTRFHGNYIAALVSITGRPETELRIAFYRRIKSCVERCPVSLQAELTDKLSVLGRLFRDYVNALFEQGKLAEIDSIREYFAVRWNSLMEAGDLGFAALRCGHNDLAEQYFLRVFREGDYHRWECMSDLAAIWFQRGEVERADALLIDCMRKLVGEIERSSYKTDRDTYYVEYQHHRATYLRLFSTMRAVGSFNAEPQATVAAHQKLIDNNLPDDPRPI